MVTTATLQTVNSALRKIVELDAQPFLPLNCRGRNDAMRECAARRDKADGGS